MWTRRKIGLVLLLTGAILAMVLLASGLSSMSLDPGQLRMPGRPVVSGGRPLTRGFTISPDVWRVVRIAILIMMPIALVYAIVNPEVRKRAIINALTMAAVGLLFYFWFRNRALRELVQEASEMAAPQSPSAPATPLTPGEFVQNPPEWLAFAITVAIVLALLAAGWALWRLLRGQPGEAELIAAQARRAVDDIRAGASFRDVVLRCYADMHRVLSAERGIQRHEAMTAREFQQRLLAAGLPEEPVVRLTHLFEAVRYGAHAPDPQEEQAAIDALTAIAQAVQTS